jgi:ABC-type nitrate/sulfonate/bicarbonate transport system permease component
MSAELWGALIGQLAAIALGVLLGVLIASRWFK